MENRLAMYHYTNSEAWNVIRNGEHDYLIKHPLTGEMVDSESAKGWMVPHRRLVSLGLESSLVPEEATFQAIFGLPEPSPESWVKYKDCNCCNMWDYLLSSCRKGKEKLVLLKIGLTGEESPIVVDYVHVRRAALDVHEIGSFTKKGLKRLAKGNKDYWDSRVKLEDYKGNFILPEVVVFSPIFMDKIEFVEEITKVPFIE